MMNYKDYFKEILIFKNRFYPNNSIDFDNSDYRALFYLINENILLCEILIDYQKTIKIGEEQGGEILHLLKNCFSRLIIALMNNDDYYIGFLSRAISELMLKLILVQSSEDSDLKVMEESYRFLNEKIDLLSFNDEEKNFIGLLRIYFSKYSDVVHVNNSSSKATLTYLTNLISEHEIELSHLISEYRKINEIFYNLIFRHSGLTYDRLGTIEISRLTESLNRNKLEKVKKILKE